MKQRIKNLIKQLPGFNAAREYFEANREKQLITLIDEGRPVVKHDIVMDARNPLQAGYAGELDYFRKMSSKFNRIVVWGFKEHFHTHRFIHKHFYETLIKLGANALWLEDTAESAALVEKNDFILAMNQACSFLPIRADINYCLHNFELPREKNIRVVYLQVYSNQIRPKTVQLGSSTFFAREERMLFQAWGTDLLPHEFLPPVFNNHSKEMVWIGSIWNNELNQGNQPEVEELKKAAAKHGLAFKHLEKISVEANIAAVRASRLAPAISGRFQVDVDYLPCRVFKNVSYGSPAITNVNRFAELFGRHHITDKSIEGLIDAALELSEKQWLEITRQQQIAVAAQHTYLHKLNKIFRAFDELY